MRLKDIGIPLLWMLLLEILTDILGIGDIWVNEKTKDILLAPVFDCGSSLYPGLSEKAFAFILNNKEEIEHRL